MCNQVGKALLICEYPNKKDGKCIAWTETAFKQQCDPSASPKKKKSTFCLGRWVCDLCNPLQLCTSTIGSRRLATEDHWEIPENRSTRPGERNSPLGFSGSIKSHVLVTGYKMSKYLHSPPSPPPRSPAKTCMCKSTVILGYKYK